MNFLNSLSLLAFFGVYSPFEAQVPIKKWLIQSYEIQLVELNPVTEYPGINHAKTPKSKQLYSYNVKFNGKQIKPAGIIQVSNDSCNISVFERFELRNKSSHVGNHLSFNLCTLSLKKKAINKPAFRSESILRATIQPLDSVFFNPYDPHNPLRVVSYMNGQIKPLTAKLIESFVIFFENTNIQAPYKTDEFTGACKPHFEMVIYEKGKTIPVLLYWDKFIIDGYVYNMGETSINPFDIRFWEGNLKFLD